VTTGGLHRPSDWEEPVAIPEIQGPLIVLVPFDGSHAAELALAWAVLIAGPADAEVVVVVAFDPPLTVKGRGAAYVEEMKSALAEEARALAEESVQQVQGRGVRARGVVVKGDVARAILEASDEESAGLIVMGRWGVTHEVGGTLEKFRSMISGGVAEKVARHAGVPVLVVS
jgi:nucleotide-binding universal stress UspA family protein